MLLETICNEKVPPLELPLLKFASSLWISDWEPLLPMLLNTATSPEFRAMCFHATISYCLLQQARLARNLYNVQNIGLAGGVFQNQLLTNTALEWLIADGFKVALPINVPMNDAGISYGQVIEFAKI